MWAGVLITGKFYHLTLNWECRDAIEKEPLPDEIIYEDVVSGVLIFKEPFGENGLMGERRWFVPGEHVAFARECK